MSNFQMPVELFMSSPVHRVEPSENLQSVYSRLGSLGVTSLAVVDDAESLVGVISTTTPSWNSLITPSSVASGESRWVASATSPPKKPRRT